MATYYSDHFSASGDDGDSLDVQIRASAGVSHGRVRYKRSRAGGLFLDSDTVRMMTFKSSDRLLEMYLTTDGASSAGAVNIGLYLTGANHDGAVVDADLFATALTTSTLTTRVNVLGEADSALIAVAGEEAVEGQALWAQAAYGAGSDTSDPQTQYDIVVTPSTSHATTDIILTLEAYYTSGD